jgi:amino acid adenylation domain-containing protein
VDGIGPNDILNDLEEVFNAILTRPGDTIRTLIPVHSLELMTESTILPVTKPKFDLTYRALEQIALRTPLKTAIRSVSGELLSYREFNAQANRFANWLIRNGAKHGEMIPLYMEKSAMTLIAIFGIIKAGLAFVPLDPRNPAERNAFIVKDVSARIIVTDQKNSEAARSLGADLVIAEDLDLSGESHVQPTISDLTPDSIIYAIYTSGSTGLPKGVLVTHAAVTASTEGMIEATGVTSDWNALWTLNYVFDAAYYDVFTIFTAGGTLSVGPQDDLLSDLAGHINKMKVEQIMLTPTITKLIKDPSQVPSLKVLNVCGERIDVNIQNWAKSVSVYNGYGPTEATILMTVDKVRPDGSLNSVGFPLKHAEAVILPIEGGSLKPVAAGEIGELCVRGPHLAQGYLNRPEQTRTAFIQDKDGTPLYRTGDIARWNEDGSLECFGRKDYQVKLNGFRIELGEIENAILQTGDINATVVSVAEIQGKRQLVAFCTFNGDDKLSPARLLPPDGRLEKVAALKPKLTTLSHYMMPSVFLPFASFPTLPSGKTNRKGLTALAEGLSGDELVSYSLNENAAEGTISVSTKEEIAMQSAWSTVLSVDKDRTGSNSSFLGFGGDSIAAINVVAACRKLKYTISVSDVLANATLGEQAKYLRPMKAVKSEKTVQYQIPQSVCQALEKHGINLDRDVDDVYPCGPGQIEFLTQTSKKEQFWNLTAIRELPEDFDLELWRKTTETLTQRNQILRTTYWQADREDHLSWFQVVPKDSCLNFEDFTYDFESQKQQLIEELRDSRFAFGSPHVRYRLLRSHEDGRRTLCVKVDHGSYDGTLLRIFDEQFKAIARGQRDLPLVHPFKNFIDHSSSADQEAALYY